MLNLVLNNLIFAPLDQFEIIYIDWIISNHSWFLMMTISFFFLVLHFSYEKSFFKKDSQYQFWFETIITNIRSLVYKNAGIYSQQYVPLVLLVFCFIFFTNLTGMIPFALTLTSHIAVTFSLALFIFLGINIRAIYLKKWRFFSIFLPSGAPVPLIPFIVFIELLSYIARVFSISIRLFANMMSGHTLLHIIVSFLFVVITSFDFGFIYFLIPFIVFMLILFLEIAIAGIQAFVFTILICLYINDTLHIH